MGIWVLVALTVIVAGCATQPPKNLPPDEPTTTEDPYRSFKPDGPGPHPAILFVSGCSGFTPSFAPKFYEQVAERLREQGFMVVFVDYLKQRELTNCTEGSLTPADAAEDLVAAATWLKTQVSIDPKRITAMGWSYGGGAVLVALNTYTDEELGFSRAVTYYPSCRAVRSWNSTMPVLMLLAGEDDVAPGKPCQQAAQRNAAPTSVKVVVYPGAHHGFDLSALPAKTTYPYGTIGYHPEAAAASWEEIQRFLGLTR